MFGCDLVRKLPLTDQNAENIKEIKGESRWWNTLKWHTDTTESSLHPYFHPTSGFLLHVEERVNESSV